MTVRSCLALLLGFLSAAGGACAKPESVAALLDRHVAAIGGEERLNAIQSVRMLGFASTSGGRWARVSREIRRPGRVRTEFTSEGVTAVYAFDGKRGWFVSPMAGVLEPAPMNQADAARAAADSTIGGPLVAWRDMPDRISTIERVTLEGRPAVKVISSAGDRSFFLDAASALIVRAETQLTRPDGVQVDVVTEFDDYRAVEGVQFPTIITVHAAGRPSSLRIEVDSIELNLPLDDSRFRQPALE